MYTQTQFGFGREGELLTGDYTGKFIKPQPKIKTIKNEFKNPAKVEEYSDKEFLQLAVSIDMYKGKPQRPTLNATHKNWSADGFRLHLLTDVKDDCKCKYCKKHESPDYHVLIPREYKGEIIVSRDNLLSALNSCEIFSREGSNIVMLYISEDGLIVSANSEEFGKSESAVNCEMKAGSPSLKIGFNAKFLIDAVKSMDEKLVFKYNGLGRPGMFISENRSALIMPMNLD
jgi:hypothetical protein